MTHIAGKVVKVLVYINMKVKPVYPSVCCRAFKCLNSREINSFVKLATFGDPFQRLKPICPFFHTKGLLQAAEDLSIIRIVFNVREKLSLVFDCYLSRFLKKRHSIWYPIALSLFSVLFKRKNNGRRWKKGKERNNFCNTCICLVVEKMLLKPN